MSNFESTLKNHLEQNSICSRGVILISLTHCPRVDGRSGDLLVLKDMQLYIYGEMLFEAIVAESSPDVGLNQESSYQKIFPVSL